MMVHCKKYNLLILVGMFFILYNPPLLPFNTMHIVGLCSIVYLLLHFSSILKYIEMKKLIYVMEIFGFLLFYLILEMFGHSLSITSLVFPIYFIVDVLPFGLTLAVYSRKKGLTTQSFLDMVLLVGTVQALLGLLSFLIPSLQIIFVDLLQSYGYGDIFTSLARFRVYGLASGLTYATPVLQSILVLLSVYFAFTRSKKYLLCAGLLAFSGIINARTSFIVIIIGGIVLLFFSKLKLKAKISILFEMTIIFIFIDLYLFPLLIKVAPNTFRWVSEGFWEIASFFQGNTTGYFSYATSENAYVLPSGLAVLWGTGYTVMGGYRGFFSDVGYVNDVWFGGIFYIVIVYTFFLGLMWSLFRKKEGAFSFLGLFMLLLYPALNIKGIAFSMNAFTNFFFLVYIMGMVSKPQICPQIKKGDTFYEC